jgi:signal transduction histidine kinase
MIKFLFARRLSGRIFRSFAISLVLIAVTSGVLITRYGSGLIVQSTANELRVLSVVLSQLIRDQFSNLEEALDNISNNDTLLSQLESGETSRKWLETYLINNLKQQSQLLDVMIYDLKGRCVGSTDPDWYKIRGRSWGFFKQGLEGFNFPSIYATESLGRVQLVSSPIFLEEEVVGVIVAVIDLERIYEVMGRKIGLSESTDAFLLDQDLRFITAGRSGVKGLVESHLASTALASHIRDEFWVGQYTGGSGQEVLGTALKISDYSWYVVVERQYSQIVRRLTAFRRGVYIVAGGLLLLFLLVSLALSRSVTRPLMRLVESTRKIAEGHYHDPVAVDGDIEELDFIATELERMRRQVAISQANLRERLSQSEYLRSESERLATIGSLAASLAHEIRNPLNAMSLLLTRLKTLSDERLRLSMVDDLFGEVRRLDGLVSSILDYARPVQLSKSSTNLKDLLSSVRDLFQSLGETKGVSIKVTHVDDVFCDVDRDKLKQCLVNLVKNSLDAVQATGEIKLSAVVVDSEILQMTVDDNGSGIEMVVQKKLFNPFFTTKDSGTGLGLTAVQKIVIAHGGQIEIQSEPAKAREGLAPAGTRVVIKIPVV